MMEMDDFDDEQLMRYVGDQLLESSTRFLCKGRLSLLTEWRRDPLGAVEQGELDRLENGENPVNILDLEYTDICNNRLTVFQPNSFKTGKDLTSTSDIPQLDLIVLELKKMYSLVETAASSIVGSSIYSTLNLNENKTKDDMAKCLSYLKLMGYSLSKSQVDYNELLSSLIADLLLYQDRLCELSGTHLSQPAKSSIIHVWLEVRWTLIVLTTYLKLEPETPLILTSNMLTEKPLCWFEQILLATMFDLAEIAYRRGESGSQGGFGCICIEELWFCIIRICQRKNIEFWKLLSSVFSSSEADGSEPDCSVLNYTSLKKKSVFWTLAGSLLNLMKLAVIDILQPETLMKCMKQELKQFTSGQNTDIPKQYLEMMLVLFTNAGPTLELTGELLTYFSALERLNAPFKSRPGTVEGSAFLPASADAWFNKLTSLETTKVAELDTYQLFVRLACTAVRFWLNNKPKDLERFWSRIKMKLSDKKALELTDCGVYRVTSLLAALAHATKQNQPVDLAIHIMKQPLLRPGCPSSLSNRCLMGLMTVALCTMGSSLSLKPLGEAITQLIKQIIAKYQNQQSDVERRHRAQDAVKCYLKFIEELFSESSLNQDESSLIFFWIPSYLEICSNTEISSILSAFTDILTRCRVVQGSLLRGTLLTSKEGLQLKELIEKLLDILYPSLQKLVRNLTCPVQAVDLGVEFLWILLEGRRRGESYSKYVPGNVIQTFTSLDIRDELRVYFLSRISDSAEIDDINTILKETTLKLVSQTPRNALLACAGTACLTVDRSSKLYTVLQECWENLSEYYALESCSSSQDTSGGELGLTVISDLMNSSYTQVLFDVCVGALSLARSENKPKQLFLMSGWLANHSMHIIYRMHQPAVGYLALVNALLIPKKSFDQAWNPSSEELQGIRTCLPLFLGSMFNNSNFDSDKSLQNTAANVFRLYFTKFKAVNHPALFIFHRSGLTCSRAQKSTILTLVCNELAKLLSSDKQAHIMVPQVFTFLSNSMLNTDEAGLQTLAAILFTYALKFNIRNDPTLRIESEKFLKDFLKTVSRQNCDEARQAMNRGLIVFYKTILPFYVDGGYRTLKTLVKMQQNVLDPTLSELQKSIEDKERVQGGLLKKLEELKSTIQSEKKRKFEQL